MKHVKTVMSLHKGKHNGYLKVNIHQGVFRILLLSGYASVNTAYHLSLDSTTETCTRENGKKTCAVDMVQCIGTTKLNNTLAIGRMGVKMGVENIFGICIE